MARARGGMRTRRGNVTAKSRRATGGGKGLRKGAYPVFDAKSARSAIRLRGHSSSKKAVLDKVARYASRTHNAAIKAAVVRARRVDRRG